MSRGIKVLWIVIGSLFAAGVFLSVAGYAFGGTGRAWFDRDGLHFGQRVAQTYEIADLNSEQFDYATIELIEANVELVPASSYGYKLSYTGYREPSIEVSRGELNELRIRGESDTWHIGMDFLPWDLFDHHAMLTIYVPSDATLDSINLYTVSGSSSLQGNDVRARHVNYRSASGSVDLKALTLEQLVIDVASGDVRLENVSAKGATFEMISGRLDYNQGTVDSLVLDMVSGRISFKGTVTSGLSVHTVSGDADLELTGSEDAYSLALNRVSGDVRVNGRLVNDSALPSSTSTGGDGNAAGNITIDTISGSVNIVFDE
ncbi:MAG: DUF4097 domain-containing protein [Coriobacteriales bacterium]|jgi:hypothetical protein|nr:DUF4097 domain-containing protein [Coriobacteriales bacterium]